MRRELKRTGQELKYLDLMDVVQDMVDTMTGSSAPGSQSGQQPLPPLNPFGSWQGDWKGNWKGDWKGKGKDGKGKGKGKSSLPQELQDERNAIPIMTQNFCVYFQKPQVGPGDRIQFNGEWRCRNPNCRRIHLDAPPPDQDAAHRWYKYALKVNQYYKAKADATQTADQSAPPPDQAGQQGLPSNDATNKGADPLPDAWSNMANKSQ